MESPKEILATEQTLMDHLVELRSRLMKSLVFVFIATIGAYNFSTEIFDFIRMPILPYLPESGLVFTGPTDKFVAHLKVSFFTGVIFSCPFWLFQAWKFIAPGLYTNEKRYSAAFIGVGSILFLLGIVFAYFVVFPIAFEFLLGFGGETDRPMITIDQYLSFFLFSSLMFGVAFELPLIIVILGMLGVVSSKFLREKRRFAIVGLAVFAAILTPPDVLSMSLMLGPMVIMYEISAWIVALFEKKRDEELDF